MTGAGRTSPKNAPADLKVNNRSVRHNEIVWLRSVTYKDGTVAADQLVSRYRVCLCAPLPTHGLQHTFRRHHCWRSIDGRPSSFQDVTMNHIGRSFAVAFALIVAVLVLLKTPVVGPALQGISCRRVGQSAWQALEAGGVGNSAYCCARRSVDAVPDADNPANIDKVYQPSSRVILSLYPSNAFIMLPANASADSTGERRDSRASCFPAATGDYMNSCAP